MPHSAALPFVLRRDHDVIGSGEITSTKEQIHGILFLDGERLAIQWRTSREISRFGREIRTDRELTTIQEVAIPLSRLAGARVRRMWRRWWWREVIVLTATDLTVFDGLTAKEDLPGPVLEHPAEIVLDVRRSDRSVAGEFVSELRLAISEQLLASYEDQLNEARLPNTELPVEDIAGESDGNSVRSRSAS